MKTGPKASFKLRPSEGNVLELTQIKREPVAIPEATRRKSKSWQGKLMRKLKNKESSSGDDLDLYKELKLRTSTFRTYPFISLYFLAFLRFFILAYTIYLLVNLWQNFNEIINELAGDSVLVKLKEHQFLMKFFAGVLVASKDGDRCLMLTGLACFLPMLSIFYGYLVGFLITLYTATSTDDLDKSIWLDYCEKKERGSTSKSFFVNRLEGCSARLDCVLGYAFTLPVLNFLSTFNFKTVPTLSIASGFVLIFFILVDELMILKRKFEIEALLKLLKMYSVIGIFGLCWIFFIRFFTTEYLEEKLSTRFTDDLGIGIFVCVIIFTVHAAGAAAKFGIRRAKPSEPKIISVPEFSKKEKTTKKSKRRATVSAEDNV